MSATQLARSVVAATLAVACVLIAFPSANVIAQPPSLSDLLSQPPDTRLDGALREPFGAEDRGSEDNSPSIPEPLFFDLVRGLGAQRGEFETNVLALVPIGGPGRVGTRGYDPFGLYPAATDHHGIEWAPEVEYAVADGLAFEFEVPYEGSRHEAYKFASQVTFGTALDNRFIHGFQTIVEPDVQFEKWVMDFLYLAGMQFNETWSALGMIGVRPQIQEGRGLEHMDGIVNLTVFADVDEHTTFGIETNLTIGGSQRTALLVLPQVDYELTDCTQIQAGVGAGFTADGVTPYLGVRAIYSR
ncbi:MAG: hypothetical protein U0992_03125 [Planctomycetaceae bacterium]